MGIKTITKRVSGVNAPAYISFIDDDEVVTIVIDAGTRAKTVFMKRSDWDEIVEALK